MTQSDPMEVHVNPWKPMEIHGRPWKCMETHGSPWKSMEVHGSPWKAMEIHGNPWKSMEVHGHPQKSMEILRKVQQVFKMAENIEKLGFTFFAFLPPYIGVSGFLAYPKEKNFSRSIDWYRKFFISCLVARYRPCKKLFFYLLPPISFFNCFPPLP